LGDVLVYPGLMLLVIALARPQMGNAYQEIRTFGVDMILILDTSGSMDERDMSLNFLPVTRLDAAKLVMEEFIEGRKNDRIGLIAFASFALTRCPLTLDYPLLLQTLKDIDLTLFPEEMRRTAIGNVIAAGVNRLRESDAKSKVLVLLTDGTNTAGNVTPLSAAALAEEEGIKIYTIGFGSRGAADVDRETLEGIAEKTGGAFFMAETLDGLKEVYDQINELEKSEVKVKNYEQWRDLFPWFLLLGGGLLILEMVIHHLLVPRVP
jgi:Ca-activated chloride channel family protein